MSEACKFCGGRGEMIVDCDDGQSRGLQCICRSPLVCPRTRRRAFLDAAKMAEEEEEPVKGEMPEEFFEVDIEDVVLGVVRATKKSIAARLSRAAEGVKDAE